MARRTTKKGPKQVESLTHDRAKRKNIPTAELQSTAERMEEQSPIEPVSYERANPLAEGETRDRDEDLDPQIVWKGTELRLTKDQLEALRAGEKIALGEAQLVWRGKDQQDWSDLVVQAPPVYVQEKIHPKHIIEDLKKQTKARRDAGTDAPDLFSDFNGLDPEAKTEFYRHDQNWQNRMILGDSLQVMASLAERENLRGKVQCIYFDPPYGIKFNSNWQVSTRSRDVKDGKMDQITREPEQVKAFRDTWKDGIHSYLTYLRDRLTAMRDLLTESGSIFVQIGDENVHRVRALMDEVFGEGNVIVIIPFKKKGAQKGRLVDPVNDYLIWACRDKTTVKSRNLFEARTDDSEIMRDFRLVKNIDGSIIKAADIDEQNGVGSHCEFKPQHLENAGGKRNLFTSENITSGGYRKNQSHKFSFQGKKYDPGIAKNNCWKHTAIRVDPDEMCGMERLAAADRFYVGKSQIRYIRKESDFGLQPISNWWDGFGGASDRVYVVQTNGRIVERCVLMASDPGDLVLDPTCGSGTTAAVAEQWGRRWITIDTSRVALALARTRIMSARYPYYYLADTTEGRAKEQQVSGKIQPDAPTLGDIRQGFVYERKPHITSAVIANNAEIDVIWDKWQEVLEPLRAKLNRALGLTNPPRPSLIREGDTPPRSPLVRGEERGEAGGALALANPPRPSLIREGDAGSPPDKGDTGGLPDKGDAGSPPDKGDTGGYIPYNPALKEKARDLRKNATPAEKKLWREILSGKHMQGLKFLRQKPLDQYIVDFYCAELLLAIEIDGDSHAEQADYDQKRSERLAEYSIQVLRYTNAEVMENIEGVYADLAARLKERATNPPRPSLIREGDAASPPDKGDAASPPDKGDAASPPDKGDIGGWEEWEIPREADDDWPEDAKKLHTDWWEARIKRQQEIDKSIARKADVEYLYDRPYEDNSKVRVAGPFTVESLSPHRVIPADQSELIDDINAAEGNSARIQAPGQDFASVVLENLKSAGVQQSDKQDRITFTAIEGWPGDYVGATGAYEQGGAPKKAAVFIGPEFGSVTRTDLMAAAREANDARFDVLIACGFNFDAHSSELSKLGPLPILKAKINPDLHMADDLKNTGAGNMFVVFGEPDIEWRFDKDGNIVVEVLGIDVFDPKAGEVRPSGKDDIAAWFIDTDYNEESFFVRHAYFMGANDPYKQLKTSLKAEIDPEAWATLYRDTSRPFERPSTGRFAVKVINHLGDEVMKVFGVYDVR